MGASREHCRDHMPHVTIHKLLCIFSWRCTGDVPRRLVIVDVVDHDEVLASILFTKLLDHCRRLCRATVLLHFCDEASDLSFGQRATRRRVPEEKSTVDQCG